MTVRRASLLAPLSYLALAVLGHLPAFRSLPSSTQCACEDAPQTDWFLAWTPHALAHGHAPWTTSFLNVPDGVNLAWNTLLPLPALLVAPVTATLGPLAAHTLLAVAAFAASATAMWWVTARWVRWAPARWLAGLFYGFSPYLVAQGTGHLNLSLVMLPPVILALLDDGLVRQERPPSRTGLLLGAVALAQLLTTEEVLASTFVMCLVGLVVLLLVGGASVDAARVRHAAVVLGIATLVLAAGAAWPLWVQFAGPHPVTAAVQDASPYAADLLGPLVPTVHQLVGTEVTKGWAGNVSENGSYLGLPLLLVLGWLARRTREVAVARFAVLLGLLAFVLSLGDRLHVAGQRLPVPLPFAVLARIPVLENLAAVRFANYVALSAALLLAVGLDRARDAGALRPAPVTVAALASLVALLPAWPYSYGDAHVPGYFSGPTVDRIPAGGVALTYPVPRFPRTAPMQWQAVAGFRYRSVGGYVITADDDGSGTFRGGITVWERVVAAAGTARPPVPHKLVLRDLRQELEELHVRAILVADVPGADDVLPIVTALMERPPDEVSGGVSAWYR